MRPDYGVPIPSFHFLPPTRFQQWWALVTPEAATPLDHRLFQAQVMVEGEQAGDLYFCSRCAAHTAGRLRLLAGRCPGTVTKRRAAQHSRICAGKHPQWANRGLLEGVRPIPPDVLREAGALPAHVAQFGHVRPAPGGLFQERPTPVIADLTELRRSVGLM